MKCDSLIRSREQRDEMPARERDRGERQRVVEGKGRRQRDSEGDEYSPSSEELVSILAEKRSKRCIERSAKGGKEGEEAERSRGGLTSTT